MSSSVHPHSREEQIIGADLRVSDGSHLIDVNRFYAHAVMVMYHDLVYHL